MTYYIIVDNNINFLKVLNPVLIPTCIYVHPFQLAERIFQYAPLQNPAL